MARTDNAGCRATVFRGSVAGPEEDGRLRTIDSLMHKRKTPNANRVRGFSLVTSGYFTIPAIRNVAATVRIA